MFLWHALRDKKNFFSFEGIARREFGARQDGIPHNLFSLRIFDLGFAMKLAVYSMGLCSVTYHSLFCKS